MAKTEPNPLCRDCGEAACFRITSTTNRGGVANIFYLCRAHATEDQPRRASPASVGNPGTIDVPITVRTLSDIVYVANMIAGAHFEWLHQDIDPEAGQPGVVRQQFADLLPEIDASTLEMQAVFA